MNTSEIENIVPAFTPSFSRAIVSPRGKEVGKRYTFVGAQSASEIRKALRAKGAKGAALDKQVNDVLSGNAVLSTQLAVAFVIDQASKGKVWDTADERAKSASLRAVSAVTPVAKKKAKSLEELLAEKAELEAAIAAAQQA